MSTKQVVVVRRDLHMGRGKEIAQGGHGSWSFASHQIRNDLLNGNFIKLSNGKLRVNLDLTEAEAQWFMTSFAKIALQTPGEEDLQKIHEAALSAGLTSHLVVDSGKTEFHGVPTTTCVCVGPDYVERIDPVTGGLKRY